MQEFTFAHSHSSTWNRMNAICREEGANLVGHLNDMAAKSNDSIDGGDANAIIDFRMIVLKVGLETCRFLVWQSLKGQSPILTILFA